MAPMMSQAQRGYMWKNHPQIAKKFEKETPDNKKLPEYVSNARKKAIESRKWGK